MLLCVYQVGVLISVLSSWSPPWGYRKGTRYVGCTEGRTDFAILIYKGGGMQVLKVIEARSRIDT